MNLKINTLQGKLANNRLRWYRHDLRIIEDRIPATVLNTKVKQKQPRGRPRSIREQQVRKNITQKEGRTREETAEEEAVF
jgi:hypothetical protein